MVFRAVVLYLKSSMAANCRPRKAEALSRVSKAESSILRSA